MGEVDQYARPDGYLASVTGNQMVGDNGVLLVLNAASIPTRSVGSSEHSQKLSIGKSVQLRISDMKPQFFYF